MIRCCSAGSLPYLDFFQDDRGILGVEVLILNGRGWARWMATRSLVCDLHCTRNGIGNSARDDRTYHSGRFRSTYCHSLFCEASNGKLFLAELPENAQKILDVETGTGAWAIEVGETHPHALVVGIDLSPIQPQHVPPNVEFQIDDFNEPWTFKDNSLDYINMRFLTGSVRDWKFLAGEAYRCLKEDGILESSEPSFLIESDDDTVGQTSAWNQWHGVFEEYEAHTVLDRRSLWYKRAYKDRLWKRHTSVTSESLTIRYRLENGQEIQSTDG
ncbi:UMTA [Colletotrichum costaricense]|uniref:UMTA n=1 Tax=Colletotrichum costaricense TaxID=1209916 RepID=A0AAI9YEG6_9PEZI|nr:UMTA [Colletotrichum costaricense]KAK1502284.1 UMTA [Colletotrichum costaricense]